MIRANSPRQAVIVDGVRTPIGRAHKNLGVFRNVRGDDLAVAVVKTLLARTAIDPCEIDDVLFGVSGQREEQGFNLARMIALMSGIPSQVPAATVNRLCGGGMQTLIQAAHAIMAGFQDVCLVGGVEHMHHIPMETADTVNPKLFDVVPRDMFTMGNAAEALARKTRIPRQRQDEYALQSHRKATAAQAAGAFQRELVPVPGHDRKDNPITVEADQCIRPDTTMEQLSSLQPAFDPATGTVTAGNSAPLNDGAAALLMMSAEKAQELGLKPIVRVVSTAVAGVDPADTGMGPVPAVRRALALAGLTMADIDIIELNESFAVQSLACIDHLELDEEKVNPLGGGIALGHPLGATGSRITATLMHQMVRRDATFGLATVCIGMGQGIATIFERVN